MSDTDHNIRHGTDGPCYLCGEVTCSVAGNPHKWPAFYPYSGGNGKWRRYCTGCVIDALDATEPKRVTRAAPPVAGEEGK